MPNEQCISLRLLALILCSNCSNTFNKVLTTIGGHMLNYFLEPEGSLELAQYPSRMVEAFHSRHDLCTPTPTPQTPSPKQHPINKPHKSIEFILELVNYYTLFTCHIHMLHHSFTSYNYHDTLHQS